MMHKKIMGIGLLALLIAILLLSGCEPVNPEIEPDSIPAELLSGIKEGDADLETGGTKVVPASWYGYYTIAEEEVVDIESLVPYVLTFTSEGPWQKLTFVYDTWTWWRLGAFETDEWIFLFSSGLVSFYVHILSGLENVIWIKRTYNYSEFNFYSRTYKYTK